MAVTLVDAAIFPLAAEGGIKIGSLRVVDLILIVALCVSVRHIGDFLCQSSCLDKLLVAVLLAGWTVGTLVGWSGGNARLELLSQWRPVAFIVLFIIVFMTSTDAAIANGLKTITVVAVGSGITAIIVYLGNGIIGGDLATWAAAGACWAVVVFRRNWVRWIGATLAIAVVILCVQRAAIFFSLPPLIIVGILVGRRAIRPGRLVILTMVMGTVGLGLLFQPSLISKLKMMVSGYVDNLLYRPAQISSSYTRIEEYRRARELIAARPVGGNGLGFRYQVFDIGVGSWQTTAITHNIVLDVTMRLGIAITVIVLVVGFMWIVMTAKSLKWEFASSGVASSWVLLGLLFKGGVESILDKPRLAVLLALLVSLMAVGVRRSRQEAASRLKESSTCLPTRRPLIDDFTQTASDILPIAALKSTRF